MNPQILEKTENFVVEEDRRLTLYGVTWEQYETIRDTLDDYAGLKMIYIEGTLEFFMPGAKHERIKSVIGRLVETYSLETNIRLYASGSTTYRKKAEEKGLEPDESYSIGEFKEFPDFAIEVIVTSGSIALLEVYKGLEIPEVWIWRNGKLSLYYLRGENYELIERSNFLPELDIELLVRCANIPDQYDAVVEFRNAIR
ncbi:Uma2 family endonuclease [Argonema galeatum]|uniref:Uma2 family endonuclease n=1 Tax=Argonema galeatum TaxID=2942762 RepID=UPI0020128002|nr:Uma2 family endonuclease [Argonema galeatum A003/A1]